jgi:hypothetical protein
MKAACWFLALSLCLPPLAVAASPQGDLDAAARKGKLAFLLVSEPGTAGVAQTKEVIQSAMKQVSGSVLIEMNRADAGNADLVARFRVAGAPLPVILLIAPNGVIAGGMLASQVSVERLVKLAPSPKKTEVLSALQSGKAVFITAARQGMGAQMKAQESCARACGQVGAASVSILVNMDDPAEAQFLADLKVSPLATEPVTVVVNAMGQVTGTFAGAAAVGDLVAAANKKGGGCAPGACGPGSGKVCGPTGGK